jgi:hypothetical protein
MRQHYFHHCQYWIGLATFGTLDVGIGRIGPFRTLLGQLHHFLCHTNTGSVVVNDVHNLKRQNMNATQTTTITTTQSYYYTYQNNNNAETYGPTFQLYHYNGLRGGALKPFHVVTRLSADKAIGASISLGVASNQATTTGDLKMSFAPSGRLAKSIGWGRYHRVFTRLLIVEQMQNK